MTNESITPEDNEPVDWLGYGTYADTLWSRVRHGFAAAKSARAGRHSVPGADPLVVGVYGEWGVGKSRLLELIYARATVQNSQECAQRALDPAAYANSPALRLTVPVWFHPWKYEHEAHLAIPMLMHIADAVRVTLKDSQSLVEDFASEVRRRGEAVGKSADEIGTAVRKGGAWVKRVAKVTHEVASNGLVKTATGVAAGLVGMSTLAEQAVSWIEETSGKLAGDDDKKEPKSDADTKKPADAVDARPVHTVDGRYYYNVQKYLRELSHVSRKVAREHHVRLDHDVHLDFVVFVDDLDRCLPEKAVEVLEVIKTVLNTENFAFVVALDDEVIERGIAHRYRDYRFGGARMPITGFEYLEKIVHLPFRLPQLSRVQARHFVMLRERALTTGGTPRLWFVEAESEPGMAAALMSSPLLHILLDCFEMYVPRKLARVMELMQQYQQLLAARGITLRASALPAGGASQVDARLVLFCALMQLFAPEVFRLLRRRPGLFGQWMRATIAESTGTPTVFEWVAPVSDDQPLVIEVSDSDLYRWAALGSMAGLGPDGKDRVAADSTNAHSIPNSSDPGKWSAYVAQREFSQSDRHTIEQLRLPFAVAIDEFRDTQRHAFSPLRLGAAMAHRMDWRYTDELNLQLYLQLFAGLDLRDAPAASDQTEVAMPSSGVTLRSINIRNMLELIESADAASRASLSERLGLKPGDRLDVAAVAALASRLDSDQPEGPSLYLAALSNLAPYLDAATLAAHSQVWDKLRFWVRPPVDPSASMEKNLSDIADAAAPYARLQQHGLASALKLARSVVAASEALTEELTASKGSLDERTRKRVEQMINALASRAYETAMPTPLPMGA